VRCVRQRAAEARKSDAALRAIADVAPTDLEDARRGLRMSAATANHPVHLAARDGRPRRSYSAGLVSSATASRNGKHGFSLPKWRGCRGDQRVKRAATFARSDAERALCERERRWLHRSRREGQRLGRTTDSKEDLLTNPPMFDDMTHV